MHASSHSMRRRRLLQGAGAMASLGIAARSAAADAGAAFPAQSFDEAIFALGGVPRPSPLVTLEAPGIADNGAFVPVIVASALPGTREIVLLVDVNPQAVALRFAVPDDTEAFVATRIRMSASGTVWAAVRTDQGLYAASRAVQVSVGGCG